MHYLLGAILIFVAGIVAADESHWPLVHRALELGRERSGPGGGTGGENAAGVP